MVDGRIALAIGSWSLYALGICSIFSRIISRVITLGSIRKLQLDDWVMVFILIPFTGTVICANEAYASGVAAPTEAAVEWSRKMRFALEEFQISTNWLVKGCLLVLYCRIFPVSMRRTHRRLIDCTSVFCVFSYIAIQVCLPLWCQPLDRYWVPSDNAQCTTYSRHSILVMILGTITTLAILVIPVPFIPTPRKVLLAVLLCLGLLSLIAGIIARYLTAVQPSSLEYLHWHTAETTLTILFANLPFFSSLISTTASARIGRISRVSSNLSLSQWPRSYRDSPQPRTLRKGIDSTATDMSVLSPPRTPLNGRRVGSIASTFGSPDKEDLWCDAATPPPTPVLTRTPEDPPVELEDYWFARRVSYRDVDLTRLDQPEPQSPKRFSNPLPFSTM